MLYTTGVILLLLWLIGLFGGYTLDGQPRLIQPSGVVSKTKKEEGR